MEITALVLAVIYAIMVGVFVIPAIIGEMHEPPCPCCGRRQQ